VIDYAFLLVAALAVVVGVWLVAERIAAARLGVRARVVVNLNSGQAVTGVLWARRGRTLVVRDAAIVEPGRRDPIPADGDVLVDREQVAFVQRVGA
jgi:hypothetical protein